MCIMKCYLISGILMLKFSATVSKVRSIKKGDRNEISRFVEEGVSS